MHIRKIDLNLLPIFDAVMSERSVTAAGRRLGMSTSAVSHALARLRDLTGDELFEHDGRGVRPTEKAFAMARSVHEGIDQLQAALGHSDSSFDPATAARQFAVDIPATTQTIFVPPLVRSITQAGPRLGVKIASERASAVLDELRYGDIELAIDYEAPRMSGLASEVVYAFEFALLARREHPILSHRKLTRTLFEQLGHVAMSWTRTDGHSPLAEHLAARGIRRDVRVRVGTLCVLPDIIEQSDLVVVLNRKVAEQFQDGRRLTTHQLPFKIGRIELLQVWHQRFEHDAGHRWLRETMKQVCRAI